jgi:ribosome-associated toxin RatA of RatAB toxin-antitoxin module
VIVAAPSPSIASRNEGEPGMTFEESVVIDAPAAELFDLSQDYARRLKWDPFLRSAALVGGASEPGVGVRAVCVARSGWAMETEYVSFNPPRATAVKMTRGPWFLDAFAGSWRFEEIEPGQTRVDFCYNLQARPRWLSWLLHPILAWSFTRDTRARLHALKDAVERRGCE